MCVFVLVSVCVRACVSLSLDIPSESLELPATKATNTDH